MDLTRRHLRLRIPQRQNQDQRSARDRRHRNLLVILGRFPAKVALDGPVVEVWASDHGSGF